MTAVRHVCPSVVVYAVDHIVAPSTLNNTRKMYRWRSSSSRVMCSWRYFHVLVDLT